METPIKIQLVKSLSNLKPSRIIAVKKDIDPDFSLYITDVNGVPYPIKNNVAVTGVNSIVNTDGTLNVVGSSNIVINIKSTLLATINSALQSGANISELINNEGYITVADLPTKTSDLINDGSDNTSTYVENDELGVVALSNSFLDLYDIPPTFTPSSHTHIEADITDLDKYTQLEVNNFLADKEDLSNKKTDLEANKTSNIFYTSCKAVVDWVVARYQLILVSGTNIKTVNGNSLLGSGDLAISGGSLESVTITNFWNHGSSFNYIRSNSNLAGFNRETLDQNTGATTIVIADILASSSFYATSKSKYLNRVIIDCHGVSGTVTEWIITVKAYQKTDIVPYVYNVIDIGDFTFTKGIGSQGFASFTPSVIEIPDNYLVTCFLRKAIGTGFDIKASITFKFEDYV